MFRRDFLAGATVLAFASPAFATDRVDEIVRELGREGFTRIEVGRTWLGRTRIVASGPSGTREIVLQPSTGEVLRDLRSDDDDDDDDTDETDDDDDDDDSGQGRGRGRGRGGDDSDNDSDDGDSDDDDGGGQGRGRGGDDSDGDSDNGDDGDDD